MNVLDHLFHNWLMVHSNQPVSSVHAFNGADRLRIRFTRDRRRSFECDFQKEFDSSCLAITGDVPISRDNELDYEKERPGS